MTGLHLALELLDPFSLTTLAWLSRSGRRSPISLKFPTSILFTSLAGIGGMQDLMVTVDTSLALLTSSQAGVTDNVIIYVNQILLVTLCI